MIQKNSLWFFESVRKKAILKPHFFLIDNGNNLSLAPDSEEFFAEFEKIPRISSEKLTETESELKEYFRQLINYLGLSQDHSNKDDSQTKEIAPITNKASPVTDLNTTSQFSSEQINAWKNQIENHFDNIAEQSKGRVSRTRDKETDPWTYHFAKSLTTFWILQTGAGGKKLSSYPGTQFIQTITKRKWIRSATDLAAVWSALGLRVVLDQ